MQFAIDEAYLPVRLTASPMTDAEFWEFCGHYPNHLVEMTPEGEIVIMPPSNPLTGARNMEVNRQLANWTTGDRRGIATGAASGFALPNGSRLAPDSAWTSKAGFGA